MRKLIPIIILILSLTLILVGCGNSEEVDSNPVEVEEDIEKTEEIEDDKIKETVEEDSETDEDEEEGILEDIFGKAKKMDAYYYEVYMNSVDGPSLTTKVWFSDNKTKMESYNPENEETIIMIMNEEEEATYMYMPAENMAIKMKYDSSAYTEEGEEGTQDYVDIMKELADDEEISIENGTLEGESVKIVTGEIMGNTNKIWISNKTGFPLKAEFYMDGELESTSEFKNFEEKTIDPSIFIIPEGVEIMDMTEGIEGIPN